MRMTASELTNLDKKYRLHLINSITGVKPGNLIATRSKSGVDNVAIFSSVVHLGSFPAQLGFVMRPQTPEIKDTYKNIIETNYYTINHVSESFLKKAHYTSAKLDENTSEFDVMNIEKSWIDDFDVPFVRQSPVKMGMKLLEAILLPNDCIFMVGEVVTLEFNDNCVNSKGEMDLSVSQSVGISGLNTYYSLDKTQHLPFVRENEIPNFSND